MVVATRDDVTNTNFTFTARDLSESVTIVASASNSGVRDALELAGVTHILQLEELMGEALARRVIGNDGKAHVVGELDGLFIAETGVARTSLPGKTVAENLADLPGLADGQDVFHALDDPIKPTGHIQILKGNLAPGGGIDGDPGIVFGAANAYIGLKVGITVGASIPAAVIAIAVSRFWRSTVLENNMVQTVGSAGESLAAGVIFTIPALSLAVSAMFILLMSGLIMFQTQAIVRGGETNYIMATVTLFVSIYNLFASLLQILGFLGGEE